MAKIIDSLAFGESSYILSIPYGTCSDAGDTVAKTVTIPNWVTTLDTDSIGARISVQFQSENQAATPTLNVNNTGAKQIRYNGSTMPATQYWDEDAVVEFVYDGTYWNIVGSVVDNDTKYSLRVGASTGTTNAKTDDGSTYIKLIKNSTIQDKFKIDGSGGTTVTSDASGNITITSAIATTVESELTTSAYYLTGSLSAEDEFIGNLAKREDVYVDVNGNIVAKNIPATGLIWQTF